MLLALEVVLDSHAAFVANSAADGAVMVSEGSLCREHSWDGLPVVLLEAGHLEWMSSCSFGCVEC